ncbi:MAG: hypothetical protein LVR00_02400 [Rhabdochlamydiaceae bacterium]
MKKTLLLFLALALSTAPISANEDERNGGAAAEAGGFSATAWKMMGWGGGLAVVAGGLAALFGSGSGSCSH